MSWSSLKPRLAHTEEGSQLKSDILIAYFTH